MSKSNITRRIYLVDIALLGEENPAMHHWALNFTLRFVLRNRSFVQLVSFHWSYRSFGDFWGRVTSRSISLLHVECSVHAGRCPWSIMCTHDIVFLVRSVPWHSATVAHPLHCTALPLPRACKWSNSESRNAVYTLASKNPNLSPIRVFRWKLLGNFP